MSSVGDIGLNCMLMASSLYAEALKMRAADSDIRTQMQRKAAAQGGAVTDLEYTIGPDGQMYATSATITTTKRISGTKTSLGVDDPRYGLPQQNNQQRNPANDNDRGNRTPSFGDILPPKINISPFDLARLQEDNSDIINKLQVADAGVRAHEHQHFTAAGGLTSGTPIYELTQGPDGKLYATSGEVRVSTTPTNDPQKAARDSNAYAAAATAPGDASAADLSIARGAYSKVAQLYSQTNSRMNVVNILDMAA
ncbi:MAG: putative metalloprotease CJM1_0395 family protein [Rickettsiales bacterium]